MKFIPLIIFLALPFNSLFPATANTEPVSEQVEAILKVEPSAIQVTTDRISLDSGSAILVLQGHDVASPFSPANCPSGKFCAYSSSNGFGSYIIFSSCTATNSVASLGTVRSVVNKRTAGNVYAYKGNTVRYTIAQGATVNTSGTLTRLGC